MFAERDSDGDGLALVQEPLLRRESLIPDLDLERRVGREVSEPLRLAPVTSGFPRIATRK
jgi:hypothetical protein